MHVFALFLAALAKMTPESIEYYTKQFKYLSKTFPAMIQKFCLFWPQSLQEPKTFQKNPTGQLLWKETYLSSLLSVEFFPILSGAPQSNAALPKSSDGKTSKAWLNARRFEDHENNFLNSFRWNLVNNLFVMSTVFLFSKKWLFFVAKLFVWKKSDWLNKVGIYDENFFSHLL